MKKLIVIGLAAMASAMLAGTSLAQESYQFAVVPKAMNNPFFDLARDGCMARAAELGNVECIYIGPVEHEAATQAQIIEDLITQGVDGLAISVSDTAAATTVINRAVEAGIAVITFDSDAADSQRTAYVGTNNKEFGTALGELLLQVKPEGGTYGMISGGAAAPNLAERVDGVREALAGSEWTEVPGSPTFSNDDSALGLQQMGDLKTANPEIGAIVPVGGWPMFAPDGWRNFVDGFKADVDSKALALVVADTLPVQLELLKEGYAHGLVGQRPYEMGVVVMDTLLAIKNGETVEEIIYTGLDRVTAENVDEFLN
ncbi:sugar ABC transporter substrate-binding protein [Devosia geojensis]|uniref:Sugar ABC transporter substrate-binding protein n=1 Tax=Devosia geojensis TaxID=443610 RepID=A0A0F5FQC9_9HYPH|nr:sugar-binding protein [Devosia geojensis]KKB10790.1 sugar ABC transporter substrate-binding protein [Devosia geojensis]